MPPIFQPDTRPGAMTDLELIEFIGSYIAGQYMAVEAYLVEEIARRVSKELDTTSQMTRVAAIRELRAAADKALAELNTTRLAAAVINMAATEGEAAAVAYMNYAGVIGDRGLEDALDAEGQLIVNPSSSVPIGFATGITPSSAIASAQIAFELQSSFAQVNARILRSTVDAYQETIARYTGRRLLGGVTQKQSIRQAVASFLSQGLTGFEDRAGRRWSIGGYTEMASRTASHRAWTEATIARYQQAGFELVSIVRGSDSCKFCAAQSGKILSVSGQTGTVEMRHATTGEPITITIQGTLASARAAGWDHPNCRCRVVAVFPGLSLPIDDTTYDPQAEKDRERLRLLERRVRALKLEQSALEGVDGLPLEVQRVKRQIREAQANIREHVANTGQLRKPYREQLDFQQGTRAALPPATLRPVLNP